MTSTGDLLAEEALAETATVVANAADGEGHDEGAGASSSSGTSNLERLQAFLTANRIEDHSTAAAWTYHREGETIPFIIVSQVTSGNDGKLRMKARCRQKGHTNKCMWWCSKLLEGDERFGLLLDYVEWGFLGNTVSADDHQKMKVAANEKYTGVRTRPK